MVAASVDVLAVLWTLWANVAATVDALLKANAEVGNMAEWSERRSRNAVSQVRVPLWSLAETEFVPVSISSNSVSRPCL